MKGTRESLLRNLLAIVLVVVLLLVSFSFLTPIVSGNIMEQITGNKSSDYVGIINKQRPFTLQWITPIFSSYPYQPSEVACEIAGKINSDFTANGLGPRLAGNGANCEKEYCIVQNAVGRFDMSNNVISNPAQNDIDNLNSKKCMVCKDSGTIIQDLDEVCINENLNSINTGLCNGPTTVGDKTATFGNKDCKAVSNTAPDNWKSFCDVFCGNDGADDILPWSSEDTTSGNAYFISDKGNSVSMPNGFSSRGEWNNDNGYLLKKQFDYMYGILWDSKNSKYVLTFAQIPKILTTRDSNDLFNIGANLSSRIYRFNRLGTWYSEGREIEHLSFSPTQDITFQTFLTNLKVFVSKNEFCSDAKDCTNTEPKTRDSQLCKTGLGYQFLWNEFKGTEPPGGEPITIRSNMGTGNFIKDKVYDISVKNWVGAYFANNAVCYDNFDRTISIYEIPDTVNGCKGIPKSCDQFSTITKVGPPSSDECDTLQKGCSTPLLPGQCTGIQAPCDGRTEAECGATTGCTWSASSTCGGSGQPCCSGSTCNSGLCISGMCQSITTTCTGWTAGNCVSPALCPSLGIGFSCTLNPFGCVGGACCCVPLCGQIGQPCCASNPQCAGGLTCDSTSGTCQIPCGASGQVCCIGSICNFGLSCDSASGTCNAPSTPWSFSMALNPTTGTATVGTPSSKTVQITVTKTSGTAQPVSLSTSGTVTGGTVTQPASCTPNPTCTSSFTVSTTATTTAGTYVVTVNGNSPGASQASATYTLTVSTTTCTPTQTCASMGYNCNTFTDDCGNVKNCGSCTGSQQCQNNVCTNPGPNCGSSTGGYCSPDAGGCQYGGGTCNSGNSYDCSACCCVGSYSLSLSPSSWSTFDNNPSFSQNIQITATATSGITPQTINFAVSGSVPGTSTTSPGPCTTATTSPYKCTSSFTISGNPSTPGTYTITVAGTSASGGTQSATSSLTVVSVPHCAGTPKSCNQFNFMGTGSCNLEQQGCTDPPVGPCLGTPAACLGRGSNPLCNGVLGNSGCTWYAS